MCYSLHCCLAVFLVAFVAIDACIVYTAVLRIDSQTQMGGMSVLPYGHNASVPMMAGHPELNYIDLSTAGFELICLLVLCFAVAWDQLGLLRLGMCGFSVAIIVETVALVGLMVLVMILAIDRGGRWINRPRSSRFLQAGDRILAIGPEEGALRLRELCGDERPEGDDGEWVEPHLDED